MPREQETDAIQHSPPANTTTLGRAKQSLIDALDASRAGTPGDAAAHAAARGVFAAELRLRRAGREDLGVRLAAVDDAVTSAACRRELRQVASKIDAEIEPGVETAGFRPASDGGERR